MIMTIPEISAILGIVSTASALIISLWQWKRTLVEQTRRVRLESYRLAWDIANALHDEEIASNALELLDEETNKITTGQTIFDVSILDIQHALSLQENDTSDKARAIRRVFDNMFFAFDRMRSALHEGLITDKTLSEATFYYCKKLTTNFNFILEYGSYCGYHQTVEFIKQLSR